MFPTTDDRIDADNLSRSLRTRWLGRNLYIHQKTGSTNDDARRLANAGAPHGTIVLAEEQDAGRGRMHRRWIAPAGSSLLFSIIFRPELRPKKAQQITMLCGLAVADAVLQVVGVHAGLKWPNDLLISGRKVAGILTESSLKGDQVDFVVVGIGINVNFDLEQVMLAQMHTPSWEEALMQDPSLELLEEEAISLMMAAGKTVRRVTLLCAILEHIETRYDSLLEGALPHREWEKRMGIMGLPVRVETGQVIYTGIVAGVGPDGALLLDTEAGLVAILAGDVHLSRGSQAT